MRTTPVTVPIKCPSWYCRMRSWTSTTFQSDEKTSWSLRLAFALLGGLLGTLAAAVVHGAAWVSDMALVITAVSAVWIAAHSFFFTQPAVQARAAHDFDELVRLDRAISTLRKTFGLLQSRLLILADPEPEGMPANPSWYTVDVPIEAIAQIRDELSELAATHWIVADSLSELSEAVGEVADTVRWCLLNVETVVTAITTAQSAHTSRGPLKWHEVLNHHPGLLRPDNVPDASGALAAIQTLVGRHPSVGTYEEIRADLNRLHEVVAWSLQHPHAMRAGTTRITY